MRAREAAPGRRALVVDDSEQVRVLIVTGLQRAGYDVDSAGSAAEALGLGLDSYDVLLVDLQLGADRGTEVIDRLRDLDPSAASRCLLMTGGSVPDLPADVTVLVKPFRLDELIAAVGKLA